MTSEENTMLRGTVSILNKRLEAAQAMIDELSNENTGYRNVVERLQERIEKADRFMERYDNRYNAD